MKLIALISVFLCVPASADSIGSAESFVQSDSSNSRILKHAQSTDLNWDAIRALVGRKTHQDGPNCYNATFLAKGWTSVIAQTSDEEFKYYLWHFCEPVKDDLRAGDIFVQTAGPDRDTEHGAVFLGDGMLFEKPSIAGLYGGFAWAKKIGTFEGDLEREATYAIRKTGDSDYFHETRNDYRCLPQTEVRRRLATFYRLREFAQIQKTKKLLSKLSFMRFPKKSEEFKRLPAEIDNLSRLLEKLKGDNDQDLFLYANAESIAVHVFNFVDGLRRIPKEANEKEIKTRAYQKQLNRLDMSMRCFVERIRKARSNPETDFIVRQVVMHAYVEPLRCPRPN